MPKPLPRIHIETKQEALEMMLDCGAKLARLEDVWRDDYDIVMAAVKSFPLAIEYASKRLKDDEKLVLTAIKREPRALTYASKRISNDDKFRNYAFYLNGGPFIVDKEAFKEFKLLDYQLIQGTIDIPKYIRKKLTSEEILKHSSFYKRFVKYYAGDATTEDIKEYERWLVRQRKLRLKGVMARNGGIETEDLED